MELLFLLIIFILWALAQPTSDSTRTTKSSKRTSYEHQTVKDYVHKQEQTKELFDKEAYLQSMEWRLKRVSVLQRDGYQCQICFTIDNLNVHHITYDNLGREPLSDLVTLCECHHTELHEKLGYERTGYYPIS